MRVLSRDRPSIPPGLPESAGPSESRDCSCQQGFRCPVPNRLFLLPTPPFIAHCTCVHIARAAAHLATRPLPPPASNSKCAPVRLSSFDEGQCVAWTVLDTRFVPLTVQGRHCDSQATVLPRNSRTLHVIFPLSTCTAKSQSIGTRSGGQSLIPRSEVQVLRGTQNRSLHRSSQRR